MNMSQWKLYASAVLLAFTFHLGTTESPGSPRQLAYLAASVACLFGVLQALRHAQNGT